MLVMVHVGIAGATQLPQMVIDKDEGDLLATATVELMSEFDITPDPKTQAILGFLIACGMVYGPRAVMIRAAREQAAREKAATEGGAGEAGVYDRNGMAAGTTAFTSSPAPPN